MTKDQREDILRWRRIREDAAVRCAAKIMAENPAAAWVDAHTITYATQQINAIVNNAHCPECGALIGECSATCGYDGPTASDAMADGAEASRD